jgi:hypothetical protein
VATQSIRGAISVGECLCEEASGDQMVEYLVFAITLLVFQSGDRVDFGGSQCRNEAGHQHNS